MYASDGSEITSGTTVSAPTAVFASALPQQASVGLQITTPGADSANVLPYTTSSLFDVYLIDSTTSSTKAGLVGTLD